MKSLIFLYGPPGSGKTTVGGLLSESLGLPFADLDKEIEAHAGLSIPEIFASSGEAGFRKLEARCLAQLCRGHPQIVALGGGSLVDEQNRALAEAVGDVLCLAAGVNHLQGRLKNQPEVRPLLGKEADIEQRLAALLERRAEHYASFALQLDTSHLEAPQAAWQAQVKLGAFRISGMGEPYPIRVQPGGLGDLGQLMKQAGLKGPVALVCDATVTALHGQRVLESLERAGYSVVQTVIPAGEAQKTIQTVASLWQAFLAAGLERSSTVVALGGGVLTDLAGFAAATYLRGIPWAAVPTSLLGMVDASLGGKTGADLPQGKNLVGAFHSPALVLADPDTLSSLPEVELRNGLAEVVKHGILGDPGLFELCTAGWKALQADWPAVVRRAMAVKIQTIQVDPYEKGRRAVLNLGHTLGHAVETVSGYHLRHGEAVAIGLVGEARLAERIGLARPGLASAIRNTLLGLGLPVSIPAEMDRSLILAAMQFDKKKAGGSLRFALPVAIGEAQTGVVVGREDLQWMLNS